MRNYILEGTTPVLCADSLVWMLWFEQHELRRVAEWHDAGITVSTVFLGIDHNHTMRGPPVLFETMVFGGPMDSACIRSSTWREALAIHDEMVGRVLFTHIVEPHV